MKAQRNVTVTLTLAVLFTPLAACGGRAPSTVGMPNPASVHCEQLRGDEGIRAAADGGQYGVCHLPDGRVCETWSLFRDGQCKSCEQLGGKIEGGTNPDRVQRGVCHLSDGKVCDESALLRDGTCTSGGAR